MLLVCLLTVSCDKKKNDTESTHDHGSESRENTADTVKKSIPKEVHTQVGSAHIMLHYHAPAVRGRMIWGGLVPYGEVWVTGAHNATTIEFNKKLSFSGRTIDAGKYALFTIPGKEAWAVIINRNWDQHLTDEYDEKDDLLRIDVVPETTENLRERLLYNVVQTGNNAGTIEFRWEKIRLAIPFEVQE